MYFRGATFLVASRFCTTFALGNEKHMKNDNYIQLITAAVLAIGGMVLLFCGVYIDPKGEIHETLLIAFGEVATFSGALMGVDYTYKLKYRNNNGNSNATTKPPEG